MALVTVCSDFGAQENKLFHCFHCFPIYLPWSDGIGCHDLSFLNVEFWASFFTFIKRLFSSSSLSPLRVVSSVYLRLLIFFLVVLIPACASSSLAFIWCTNSAYKLNKQVDIYCIVLDIYCQVQPWNTPFPILKQSVVPCPVLTIACWPAYSFLRRQIRWYAIPISLRLFYNLL